MAAPNYNSHPLPPPPPHQQYQGEQQFPSYEASLPQQYQYQPQQSQPYQQRPLPPQKQQHAAPVSPRHVRTKPRGFSFRSDKSHKSSDSHHKIDLTETTAEKESNRLHSKADPTLAMHEAEPAAVAQMTGGAVLKPLSSIQHRDSSGNVIAEPDRSNPTRSKWERPLDTIRSFEAAVDGAYKRKSFYRSDSDSVANFSRRASYYGNNGPRFPQDSYYSGRNSAFRPESVMMDSARHSMMGPPREVYADGYNGYNDGRNNRYSRMQSDPSMSMRPQGDKNVYPVPNNHRSYETVASGSGSGSYGEPAGYQTDPTSSENSSINRRSPPKRQEPTNDYGISFGQSPSYQPPNLGMPVKSNANSGGLPPVPPKKEVGGSLLRKASKVGSSSGGERPGMGEKRKSWFARRFSKNS